MKPNCSSTRTGSSGWNSADSIMKRANGRNALITRGAAVESVAPEVRPLSEQGFYALAQQIFSMPEVRAAVHAAAQREGE